MMFSKEIEHGGYPTSETRTIAQMRRDADLYSGIGRKMKKEVDNARRPLVGSLQPPIPTATVKEQTMTLTLRSISKNGKRAFYAGAASMIHFPLSAFVDKKAPDAIEIEANLAPVKQPKRKLTKEERAALPKPTLAEKVARAQARAAALAAKLAAEQTAGDQPEL